MNEDEEMMNEEEDELTEQMIARAASMGKKPVIKCDPGQEITKHIALKSGFVRTGERDGLNVYRLP